MAINLEQSGGGGGGSTLPSGTQNQVIATPSGSSGVAALRALVAADIPTIAESQVTNLVSDLAGKQASLGFTPENAANKAAANGYAGLDANGKLSLTELPDSGQSAGNGAYMWTMDCEDASIGGTATIISPTGANNVLAFKFVCRKTITIRKVVFENGTTVTALATANFGIYDATGNLLLDSGAFSTATASQTLSNTLASSVTLYNNTVYYFAQACSNSTNNALGNGPSTLSGSVVPGARNKSVVRQGIAANAYNGTALPPTLGTVTGFVNRVPVAVFFES